MTALKKPYFIYDRMSDIEYANGCLKIFLPTEKGYVNYNIVRSVRKEINADVWRLGMAFACGDSLDTLCEITRFGAEWDMAVMIEGRDDFIGGSNHGDEISVSFELEIDGKIIEDITAVDTPTAFETLKFRAESVGYDPDDHETKSLIHKKEYLVNSAGITVSQKVTWLYDYSLGSCYLAMMPPLKKLTDTYFTDNEPHHKPIQKETVIIGARSATLYGKESGVKYTMSLRKYPTLMENSRFLITDNGGSPYNKMYFFACKGYSVKKGEEWETEVAYNIKIDN